MPLTEEQKRQRKFQRTLNRFRTLMPGTQKQEVARVFQKAKRMEAADDYGYCLCCCCGDRHHYKKMDAGHFIGRKHNATVFDEMNVHPQCKSCNDPKNGAHGAAMYGIFMVTQYGREAVDELIAKGRTTRQFTIEELVTMYLEFGDRVKAQQIRLSR